MAYLFKLNDTELWRNLLDKKGGVYKIISIQDGKIIPQQRFLGTDKTGTLYIGKATSFSERVINLVKSMSPNYNGTNHICGRRYKSNVNISKTFPFDTLHLEIIQTDTPEVVEKQLLTEYFQHFGEAPPLNAHY